jgi:hypothetical protein
MEQIKSRKEMRRLRNTYEIFALKKFVRDVKGREEVERFRNARERGGVWLHEKLRPDGSMGSASYKVLSALQVCGKSRAANRMCNWLVSHEMTPEGDFGDSTEPKHERAIYSNAWIVIGSHRLGRFDISQKGMDFISSFQDPVSGGFLALPSSPTERVEDTKQDLMIAGFCGLAALYTGRIEVARGAGRWFEMMMEAQPKFPHKLYTVYSRAQGLHLVPDSKEELRYLVSSDAQGDQYFFQVGVAGGFLTRLYQATGEQEWLTLAKEYMRFAEGANDSLFRTLRAGKVGWAAALLYTQTGESKYKKMALRVGDMLIARQARAGSWNSIHTPTPSADVTAEMVVWLDEIYQAAGRDY